MMMQKQCDAVEVVTHCNKPQKSAAPLSLLKHYNEFQIIVQLSRTQHCCFGSVTAHMLSFLAAARGCFGRKCSQIRLSNPRVAVNLPWPGQ